MSHAEKKTDNSQSFINPFEGREAEEVWKELLAHSEPISHEEMLKQIQEETGRKQNKAGSKE